MTKWYVIRPDGSIALIGELADVRTFAQRERYCIWAMNKRTGGLVWAYNARGFGAPDYPSRESVLAIAREVQS